MEHDVASSMATAFATDEASASADDWGSTWLVAVYTTLMALASVLGTVPFFLSAQGKLSEASQGIAHSVAIGVMVAASYSLIQEGEEFSAGWLVAGVVSGVIFIERCQKFLSRFENLTFSGLQGMDAKKALLFVGIMTLHAVGEGCGVGVAYGSPKGFSKGVLLTIAIGVHNIPEGMATATVLASKGVGMRDVAVLTVLSSMPQPLLAVPAYLFVVRS